MFDIGTVRKSIQPAFERVYEIEVVETKSLDKRGTMLDEVFDIGHRCSEMLRRVS